MSGRAAPRWLLAAALWLLSASAWAAPRVILLRPADAEGSVREALTRVQAELAAEGFEVLIRQPPPGADPRASLEKSATETKAAAALSVYALAGGAGADVWVVDRITQKMVVRRVSVGDVPAAGRPAALAIRAVELLRASLIEAPSRVPAEVTEFVTPSPPPLAGFAMQLGVGMIASVDGLGVAGAPAARLSWGWEPGVALRLGWLGPAYGARAAGPLGRASMRQERLTLDLVYAPNVRWGGLSPTVALGAGGYHLHASGDPLPPLSGASDDVWAFAVVAGLGLGYRLTPNIMALVDFESTMTAPRAVVAMRGQPLGTAGRPSLGGTLGIVARF